jgi:hypothetical protein
MKYQNTQRSSIFSCNGFSIFSNESVSVGLGITTTPAVIGPITCEKSHYWNTCLNTQTFLQIWRRVFSDGWFRLYDWTVKVDPDTVFFPLRLVSILGRHSQGENGLYLSNCGTGVHGPIEVFSKRAILAFRAGIWICQRSSHANGDWGEDMFIDRCLSFHLHIKRESESNLLSERNCRDAQDPEQWHKCTDRQRAAFHPFKSVAAYMECEANAGKTEVRLASNTSLCMNAIGGNVRDMNNVQFGPCKHDDEWQAFSIPSGGNLGLIRLTKNPRRCLQASAADHSTKLELGNCSASTPSQLFRIPRVGKTGSIKWGYTECLTVAGQRERNGEQASCIDIKLSACRADDPRQMFRFF